MQVVIDSHVREVDARCHLIILWGFVENLKRRDQFSRYGAGSGLACSGNERCTWECSTRIN